MYGGLNNSENIQDVEPISTSYKAPVGSYDNTLINKIKSIQSKDFANTLTNKSTYMVRGGVIGGVLFGLGAIYYKRGVFGSAVIGIAVGTLAGFGVSKLINQHKTEKNEQGK